MRGEYFTILALEPGSYRPEQIISQYHRLVQHWRQVGRRAELAELATELIDDCTQACYVLRDPDRQRAYLRWLNRQQNPPTQNRPVQRNCPQGEKLFRRLAIHAMEAGLIRRRVRLRLLRLAPSMGLSVFQANLIMAEVIRDFGSPRRLRLASPSRRRIYIALVTTMLAAAALDAVLIYLLSG